MLSSCRWRAALLATVVAAGAVSLIAVSLIAAEASAQCVTCGNPSFASGDNDIARTLGAGSRRGGYGVRTGLVYGFGTANSYFEGDKPTSNFDEFDMTMNLFTLVANIEAPTGTELATVLPFGQLHSTRRFNEQGTTDRGLGDLELRVRQEVMGLLDLRGPTVPRVVASVGIASPTGAYIQKQTQEVGELLGGGFGGGFGDTGGGDSKQANAEEGVDTSKYLSIGRGAWWLLGDLEVMGRITSRFGYYAGISGRTSLTDAPDGFRWGSEARVAVGANAAVVKKWLNASLQGEYQVRGKSTEVILETRQDFANGGGTWMNVMPTLQSQVTDNLSVSLSMRLPVYRDVTGVQAVENASMWLSVTGSFGFGGDDNGANPAANVAKGGIGPGDMADTEEIRSLIVPGKITIVDYWATWCKPCTKLGVVIDKWKEAKPENVVLKKFDASDWQKEHWTKFLPNAPTLPVLDIYGADGKLIARLSGDEAFRFQDHLPTAPATPGPAGTP